MTVKEAFAQAFDEAFVMDALPSMGLGSKNPNPAASGVQKNPAKASSMGGSSGSEATTSGDMMTLAEHDEKNHPGGYKGGKCSWRDSHGMSGMTLEEAQRKGLADKKFPARGGEDLESGQGDIQEPTPEMLEQQAQQIAQNPQMMEQIPSEMLPETKMVNTEAGELPAQTTVQEGILENLTEQAASGNTLAEESLQELKDKVEDGTITQSGEQQQTEVAGNEGNTGGEAGEPLDDSSLPPSPPAPEPEMISTSDGKSSRNIEPDEAMVLAANPEKKEIFQKMVDLEGMVGDLEENSPKFKDLANQYQALQRMFFGNEGGEETSLKGSQKRMFERVKKEFPDIDEKTFLENKELFDELSKLDSQIARIGDTRNAKAQGIKKSLLRHREEIKQKIVGRERFDIPDIPTTSPKPTDGGSSDKPMVPGPISPPKPPEGGDDINPPKRAAKKSDYIDALDQMHEAEIAYYQARHDIREAKDYDAAVKAAEDAKKEWEEAKAKVAEFEDASVDIVDNDGNAIDTGADRRLWAEQERVIRNAGGDDSGDSGEGGDGGSPKKLCPICSTPLKVDGTCPKQDEPWHKEGKSGPTDEDSNKPNSSRSNEETPSLTSSEEEIEEEPEIESAPPDEDFMTKGAKYKVGGVTYTDVSGKGLLGGMIASFMAGLRGEGIITAWDRISGTWDQIKRSEAGENVRDGIKGALTSLGLDAYMEKVEDPTAKGKLETIKEMFQKAKTPVQKMAAYNAFEKWKKQYIEEEEQSKDANSIPSKIAASEKTIHSNGNVLKPNQRIDNEGKIVEDNETTSEIPSTDILGEPGFVNSDGSIFWNPEAKIDNLDAKKATIAEALNMVGIAGDEADSTTSFNSTFVRYDLPMLITDKQKNNLSKQLAFSLGLEENEVSVAVDAKNKQLVIGIKNDVSADLATRDIMKTDAWKQACKKMRCPIILGRDEQGNPVIKDMKELTHLLIAGDTGKGKSVGMNTILCSMMMAKPPSKLKTVLIDLKKVELSSFEDSKHNAVPVATDIESALESLNFVKQEMENREALLKSAKVKNIDEYNEWAKKNGKTELPTMVLGIDELTELKEAGGSKVYELLKTIGNKGRASGIHLLCATQKPTKENIGEVKSAFTSRLAFPIKATEGSEAIFSKGDYRATKLAGKGSFILDVDGKEIKGKGSAMGNDDPRRIVGYWNGEKPKTDEEQLKELEKELASHNPAYTDSAQARESEEKASAEIQRKINQIKERMAKNTKLPQEHLDAISAAVEKGNPISMVATEGYMDAFKNAFPSDWEITEEDVNGEKHWKASPPSKPTGGTEGSTETKAEENVDKTPTDETKEENTDWRKDGSRDEAIATLSKVRDAAKAKAWDTYNQGEDTADAQKKLQKALEKADSDFNTKMALVDMKFPPPEDESMDGGSTEGESEEGESSTPGDNGDDDEDSSAATMKDIEETFNAERERIEKALAKPNTKVRDKQKLREERKALKKRFNEAKAKFESGGSAEDLLNIFEPEEEKPVGEGGTKTQEASTEPSDADKAEAAQQEQAQKDEKLRSTVREQKFYGAPGFKATSKITPQQVKQMENLLPAGWEFVTDNQFKAPARTKNGVVFIRHPTNGSYGRIFIKKDEKGKEYIVPEAQIDVDTTHPDYQGYIKNEDGTYGLTEEGKKAEAEFKHIRKYSKNEKERAEAQKKFNRIRFGHDEAPDNMTIVANAVANALSLI